MNSNADMKRLIDQYARARECHNERLALPHENDNILGDCATSILPIVTKTMFEVKEKVGLA